MRCQEVLYASGKTFRILVWEGALHTLGTPAEVLAGPLDRLNGLIGLPRISFAPPPTAWAGRYRRRAKRRK